MSCREVFSEIYRNKVWGEGSGGGSDPHGASAVWCAIVSSFIAATRPTSVLSIGCGDGWADSKINLNGARYVGCDVAPEMVEYCRHHHDREYIELDATNDAIPQTDLILCKEVTQHLSDSAVTSLIYNIANRTKPCLVIHAGAGGFDSVREEIETGGFSPYVLRGPGVTPIHEWEYAGSLYHAELWRPN